MIQVMQVAERLWRVVVDVEGITGETLVACETQEEAEAYARNVFLSDLRRNDWRFAHVRFPWEPEEVESDGDDTDQRYNIDRFGYLIPYRYGNLPMVGAVATYRPGEGRFGGDAIAVEEATENLWKADTQWIGYQLKTSAYEHPVPNVNLDNLGSHVTVSYEARVTSGPNVNMQVYVRSTDGTVNTYNKNPQLVEVGPEWTRVEQSVQIDNRSIDRYVWLARNPVGQVIDIRRFQVEAKPFATSFVDGSREEGFLAFPMPVDKNTGTISLWIRPQTLYIPSGTSWSGRIDLSWGRSNPNSGFVIQHYQDAVQLRIWDGVSGTNIRKSINYDVGDWIHCAITWDSPSISFFVNGEFVGVLDREIDPDDRLVIGGASFGGSYNPGNALYDELLILPYAASEEEILSWYEAQGAVATAPTSGVAMGLASGETRANGEVVVPE